MKKYILGWVLLFSTSALVAQSVEELWTGKTELSKVHDTFDWYQQGFAEYAPDTTIITKISDNLNGYTFLIFAGTWCGDTKYLLPKFSKVLNMSGVSDEKVTLYLLDFRLKSPEKLEKKYKIKSIPTFVIIKDGKETGRIVESVNEPVEKVLYDILK
ncbi:MAG TPA: thioredoxin family protein [Cytophagaceae bacterium]